MLVNMHRHICFYISKLCLKVTLKCLVRLFQIGQGLVSNLALRRTMLTDFSFIQVNCDVASSLFYCYNRIIGAE
jgi:hypothetical protein